MHRHITLLGSSRKEKSAQKTLSEMCCIKKPKLIKITTSKEINNNYTFLSVLYFIFYTFAVQINSSI